MTQKTKKIRIGLLILLLLLPLFTGFLSAFIASDGMALYADMEKPRLSPPASVFIFTWTVLYLVMGLSSYFIAVSETDRRRKAMALVLYLIQLALNFLWPVIFFKLKMYLPAFIVLILIWLTVIICTFRFFRISRPASYLMIPYILWLTFAAYLNLGTYLLSV